MDEIRRARERSTLDRRQMQAAMMLANKLIVERTNCIESLCDEMRSLVHKGLAELASVVPEPLRYLKTLDLLASDAQGSGERDMDDATLTHLDALVGSRVALAVSILARDSRRYLQSMINSDSDERNIKSTIHRALRSALEADEERTFLVECVAHWVSDLAPHLCALVGQHCAALLVAAAGGVVALSTRSASAIAALGRSDAAAKSIGLAGLSGKQLERFGYLRSAPLVAESRDEVAPRVARLIANKSAMAARIDAAAFGMSSFSPFSSSSSSSSSSSESAGAQGALLRQDIESKIRLWEEPFAARQVKALKPPDEKPTSVRGGRKARARKRRLGQTLLRAQANRQQFGHAGDGDAYDPLSEGLQAIDAKRVRRTQASSEVGASRLSAKRQRLIEQRTVATSSNPLDALQEISFDRKPSMATPLDDESSSDSDSDDPLYSRAPQKRSDDANNKPSKYF
jgi:RNA processing factor Prp31